MADMYGAVRSNWFVVKDAAAFRDWFTESAYFGDEIELWQEGERFAFGGYEQYPSAWPRYQEDGDTHDYDLEYFAELIRAHLAEGEEFRVMAAGAEKLRYVAANRLVVTHSDVSFTDMYEGN